MIKSQIPPISYDLSGKRFGKLVVVSRAEHPEKVKRGTIYWLCHCDCGNDKIVSADYLRRVKKNASSLYQKSCGCVARAHYRIGAKKLIRDLTGMKFGRLIVQGLDDTPHRSRIAKWICKCDCGNSKSVCSSSLTGGVTNSCGCLAREKARRERVYGSAAKRVYETYRRHADKRKQCFELTIEQFTLIISQCCHYCGIAPEHIMEHRNDVITYNGVDRVNNDIGYTVDNCVPACEKCNKAKLTSSVDDFYKWLERAYLFNKDRYGKT